MANALEQLQTILELEARRGYKNDAVIGGMDEYARQWSFQVVGLIQSKESAERLAQVTQLLSDYSRLPQGARPATIRHLQESLAGIAKQVEKEQRTQASKQRKTESSGAKAGASPKARNVETGGAGSPTRTSSPESRPRDGLHAPVTTLPGIGSSMAQTLARLGLNEVGDLLWHLPFRYQDYSNLRRIDQLRVDDEVTILATVKRVYARKTTTRRTLTTVTLADLTGTIEATFWNPYIDRALKAGRDYYFSGKVGSYMGKRVLESPEFEPASDDPTHTARIVPIYPLTEGLSARVLRKHIRQVVDAWAPRLPDPLPNDLRQRLSYPGLGDALQQVHFPDDLDALDRARKRLAFDELLVIQLGVLGQQRAWQSKPAQPLRLQETQLRPFLDTLPFNLTRAQQRVLHDIARDIARDYPMTRLLQGDVGSGKTVIAAAAMWAAIGNGAQAALMAPTEILAEQHYRKLGEQFAQLLHPRTDWPLRVDLLTGSVTGKRREEILTALATGDTDILIGTHALIQESVQFHDLALIVVDEQHRFGVDQRAALREKGAALNASNAAGANMTPHTLVMSATPIPRTLALTIYGDMDVSAIDELPPGRQPIKTYWIKPDQRHRVYKFIAEQVSEGRQAFIIYPLVEESDRLEDVGAATAEHKRLQKKVFPHLKVGLLHGRLAGKEKDAIMRAFAAGDYDVLVSTAVVEVGIDIPNASIMMIENADRFGLSQLHQFRGRVGRGPHQSYCVLVGDPGSDQGAERLRAMEKTQDGFELAEVDLRMRGPGEFFGTRQSGLPDLKLARMSDTRLLELARREAEAILTDDPRLTRPPHRLLAQRTAEFFTQEIDLS
ncbi:MAG: ATP-dependent DNA helicase RecG [Caldilineales bacterium]|nr:ATP-dependent DNA helicase RecG [Caldilineales bacterium]